MPRREVLVSSPLQATADSGTGFVCTITFNEPGVVDLDRMIVQVAAAAGATAGISQSAHELTRISRVTSMLLNGSEQFVKGRNTPSAPAIVFHRRRADNFVRFGRIRVSSNDTLAVTIIFIQTAVTSNASIAVPLVPDRFAGQTEYNFPRGPERYVGSPEVVGGDIDGTALALTITFDTDGWIDLGRLVVRASALTAYDNTTADGWDASEGNNLPIFIRSAILRSDYQMIVGAGTPIAPNVFDAERRMRLVDLGAHRVTAGDALVVNVALYEETTTQLDNFSASMGVPILPDKKAA